MRALDKVRVRENPRNWSRRAERVVVEVVADAVLVAPPPPQGIVFHPPPPTLCPVPNLKEGKSAREMCV